ncbi:hypothetical protein DL93DRAFT_2139663 [Clavulina sp. PMI_390]|nr:hypothetical protein DL93DRAFT_2139663 [Clavulina sp. PMI_390]
MYGPICKARHSNKTDGELLVHYALVSVSGLCLALFAPRLDPEFATRASILARLLYLFPLRKASLTTSESSINFISNTIMPESSKAPDSEPVTIESAADLAKRAFALGKFEEAVGFYATALELMAEKYGENAPESADMLFAYGKALLENAIAQSAVLGKEEPNPDAEEEEDKVTAKKASKFVFEGDGEDVVEFKQDGDAEGEEEEEEEPQAGGDDDAPEDDFNAAWEVLDLARALYEKQPNANSDETQLKIADTYITLGDISLETEKFDQAIADFTEGLKIKTAILPKHSRQITEAHYKLGLVLDLTSGRLGDAIVEVQKALDSIERRLEVLKGKEQGIVTVQATGDEEGKGKGKGAATGLELKEDDPIMKMTAEQIGAEIKEFEEFKQELLGKIEDLKSVPQGLDTTVISTGGKMSAPALAAAQLTAELGGGPSASLSDAPVNDLSGMVKKKKKAAPVAGSSTTEAGASAEASTGETATVPATATSSGAKRKLDDDEDGAAESQPEKKARTSAEAE